MTGNIGEAELQRFHGMVLEQGRRLWRDLAWRKTRDPYAIWISEVMLQQTQVARVDGRWQRWLGRFPDVAALANAPTADVLEEWQGMGYNRRALALQRAAQAIEAEGQGFPVALKALTALPGIGPTTAAGIRAFAYDLPGVYLDTNVRTVFIHELFPGESKVSDRELIPLVELSCPQTDADPEDDPRTWYYALLDLGAYLKRIHPNPSRRSSAHTKQSPFEGSHRQKRAALLRIVLAAGVAGVSLSEAHAALCRQEQAQGREAPSAETVGNILSELACEGFCTGDGERWRA